MVSRQIYLIAMAQSRTLITCMLRASPLLATPVFAVKKHLCVIVLYHISLQYPHIFTCGIFKKGGPSKKQVGLHFIVEYTALFG